MCSSTAPIKSPSTSCLTVSIVALGSSLCLECVQRETYGGLEVSTTSAQVGINAHLALEPLIFRAPLISLYLSRSYLYSPLLRPTPLRPYSLSLPSLSSLTCNLSLVTTLLYSQPYTIHSPSPLSSAQPHNLPCLSAMSLPLSRPCNVVHACIASHSSYVINILHCVYVKNSTFLFFTTMLQQCYNTVIMDRRLG
jgi:hypothetical protein